MDEDIFDESTLFSTFESGENGEETHDSAAFRRGAIRKSVSLTELDALKQENTFLKKLVRKISFNPSEDEPFASILLYNSTCQSQQELEDFICFVANKPTQNNTRKESHKSSLLQDGFAKALEAETSDLPLGCVQY